MQMQHPIRNIFVAIIGAAAIFTLGLVVAMREPAPTAAPTAGVEQASVKVSFLLDDGEKISGFNNVEVPAAEPTVLGALKKVAAQQTLQLDVDASSSMGAFVKQIGKQKNGAGQRYWQFWVDGSQPLIAADKLVLKGGETVLWTFRKSVL